MECMRMCDAARRALYIANINIIKLMMYIYIFVHSRLIVPVRHVISMSCVLAIVRIFIADFHCGF